METTQTAFKVSRVGKRPVPVPDGVQVSIADGQVQAKGPQGAHQVRLPKEVSVLQQDKTLVVEPKSEYGKRALQFHGTVRASLNNLMQGVHQGFKVALDLYGVGYRAELKGQSLTMALGLSHSVQMELPASVKAKVETIDSGGTKRPRLHLQSYDKEMLGQVAARIRGCRPPEPYKGKGVRLLGEQIRQKAGKAGGKKGK